MSNYNVRHVLKVGAQLGEAPVWSVKHQALFWLDIEKRKVNRFDPATGANKVWDFPSSPGCIVLDDAGAGIIAARDGYYTMNFETGAIKKLHEPPFDPTTHRFNDGKCDRQGRFVVGSFANDYLQTRIAGQATFYSFNGKTVTPILPNCSVTNGTAFSPDGKTMYRAESLERTIYAYDYDTKTGLPSRERVFAKVPDTLGHPDGVAMDTQGGYWTALSMGPQGSGVGRFTPDGKLDLHIDVPPLIGTMVAFGGANLATLYITSANEPAFTDRPLAATAGDLFAVDVPFQGLAEPTFRPVA